MHYHRLMLPQRTLGFLKFAPLVVAAALVACGGKDVDELVASGRTHLDKGDAKTAIVELKQALQAKPEAAETRFLLGQALLASGDPVSAVVELRKSLDGGYAKEKVAPPMARALVATGALQKAIEEFGALSLADGAAAADLDTSLAMAHAMLGDLPKANVRLEAALKRQPNLPAALLLKARMALREGRGDDAVRQIESLLASSPNDVDARMLLGDVRAFAKADPDGAIAEYGKVLALKPDHVAAHSALIALLLRQNQVDAAKSQFEKLRAAQPANLRTKYFEAQFALLGKDFAKARELTQGVLRLVPDNVDALYLASVAESNLGNQRQATAHLAKALVANPQRRDVRRYLAQLYLSLGQGDRAYETLKSEISGDRPDAAALALAAQALLQMGEFDRSRDLFQRAAKLAPGDTRVQTTLAVMSFTSGDQTLAVQQLEQISGRDKNTAADEALVSLHAKQRNFAAALRAIDVLERKGVAPALPSFLRGKIELQRLNPRLARQHFVAALEKDPTHKASVTELAALDLSEGKFDAAQARYEALLKSDPKNAIAMAEIARVRNRAGASKDEVVKRLGEAIKTDPTEVRVRLDLIDFLLTKRDAAGAVTAAQDALAVLVDSEEVLGRLGRAQMMAGNAQQALLTFRKLIQLGPKSPEPFMRLAEAYTSANNPAAAETALRQAVTAFPESISAHRALIQQLQRTKKGDAALAVARGLQQQRPKSAMGYLLESEIHLQGKNQEAAIDALKAGLRVADSADAARRLYALLATTGKEAQAQAFSANWLKSHPRDVEFLQQQGDLALQSHRYVVAERIYGQLLEFSPDNAAVLNNQAWVRVKLGKSGAVALAERALALDSKNLSAADTLAQALLAEKQTARAVEVAKGIAKSPDADAPLRLSVANLFIRAGEPQLARAELDKLASLKDNAFIQAEVARLRGQLKN